MLVSQSDTYRNSGNKGEGKSWLCSIQLPSLENLSTELLSSLLSNLKWDKLEKRMKLASLMLVRQSWKFETIARKQPIVTPQFLYTFCIADPTCIRPTHLTKENIDVEVADLSIGDFYMSTQYVVIFYLFKQLRFLSPEEYHSSYHSY